MQTKKVTAFGREWVFSENTKLADITRKDKDRIARQFAYGNYTKPSEQAAVLNSLLTYWPDIISSVVTISKPLVEGEPVIPNDDDYLTDLFNQPEKWLDFMLEIREKGTDAEFFILHDAAKAVNPHWYPVVETEPDTDEVSEAKKKSGKSTAT